MKDNFSDQFAFWGAIDQQDLLPNGTDEELEHNIIEKISIPLLFRICTKSCEWLVLICNLHLYNIVFFNPKLKIIPGLLVY